MKYSDDSHLEFPMHHYSTTRDMDVHIQGLVHTGGNTNTAQALSNVIQYLGSTQYGARQDARKVMLLVTGSLTGQGHQGHSTTHPE